MGKALWVLHSALQIIIIIIIIISERHVICLFKSTQEDSEMTRSSPQETKVLVLL